MTPAGRLCFRNQDDTIRAPEVIAFLLHPLRHMWSRPIRWSGTTGRTIARWWSGSSLRLIHSSRCTPSRAASTDLNPTEWVRSQRKDQEFASHAPHDARELRQRVRFGVMQMRDRSDLIRSFVKATHFYDAKIGT